MTVFLKVFSSLSSMLDKDKLPPGFETAYDKVMGTHLKEKSRQNNIIEDIVGVIQMGTPEFDIKSKHGIYNWILSEAQHWHAPYVLQNAKPMTAILNNGGIWIFGIGKPSCMPECQG